MTDGYYLNSSCVNNGQLTPLSSVEEQEISPRTESTAATTARMQQPQKSQQESTVAHAVEDARQLDTNTGESVPKRRRTLRSRAATIINTEQQQSSKDDMSTSASPKRNNLVDQRPPQPQLQQQQQYSPPLSTSQREKILQRNRLAAKRCRQKKKTHNMAMETRYREESARKESLVADIERLRSEYLDLRGEMLKHAACPDEPIKRHLELMVKRITSGASFWGNLTMSTSSGSGSALSARESSSVERDLPRSSVVVGGTDGGSARNEVLTWSKKSHHNNSISSISSSSNSSRSDNYGGGNLASSFLTGSTASSIDAVDFGFDGPFRRGRQGSGFSMSSFASDVSRSSSCAAATAGGADCAAGGGEGGGGGGDDLVFDELVDL